MEEILQKIFNKLDIVDNRLGQVEGRLGNIENNLGDVEDNLGNVEESLGQVKAQQEENTQILHALEHKADVHKAEMDNLNNEISHLSGNQKQILRSLEELRDEIDMISLNTAKNSLDLAKMKAAR
jgi:chromosome segregation ATPase